jgi:hypothetical protein
MNWISVEDGIPKINKLDYCSEDVLTYCVSHGMNSAIGPNTYIKGEKYMAIDRFVIWSDRKEPSFRCDRFFGTVTHWMTLPKRPKDKEE